MIGHAKTPYAAMQTLMDLLAASGLTPTWIAARIDSLTHTNVPPALRRPVPYIRLSALDQAARAAADFEHAADPLSVRYIEELW
jgi:hypothetical protein